MLRNVAPIALILAGLASDGQAQDSPLVAIGNADQVATDGLGRRLPTFAEVGGPRPGRHVGLFYWQWHRSLRAGPSYNVTEFLDAHPGFQDWTASPAAGPRHPEWYWAEPLFGYYRSTDRWVIRKHLAMIADAGVDFLFLDYTNDAIYEPELLALLETAAELKARGMAVPRVAFFMNADPDPKVEAVYRRWIKPGKYDDLWFRWRGKPLILAPMPAGVDRLGDKDPAALAELRAAFTWRPTWALFESAAAPSKWRFIDGHPQRPALGPDGRVEQLVVSKSMGGPIWDNPRVGAVASTPGHEPKYDDRWLSGEAARGGFFEEQWNVADRVAPPLLLVTGWNEWIAAVWETPGVVMLNKVTARGQGHIVDEFNMDFNRDIEPMKGGYGDAFYYQFIARMRRYKGMAPPDRPTGPRSIAVDGRMDDWAGVGPIYRDAVGEIGVRDADGSPPGVHYANTSARNDLATLQVARDADSVAFLARTAGALSPPTGPGWMHLLIDLDADPATGWEGFDLLVDRDRDGGTATVERHQAGQGWSWRPAGRCRFARSADAVELSLPRSLFPAGPLRFDFQWADNLPAIPTPADFLAEGDVAPNGRFRYRFDESPPRP